MTQFETSISVDYLFDTAIKEPMADIEAQMKRSRLPHKGREIVRRALAKRVYGKIIEAYPYLKDECVRRMGN